MRRREFITLFGGAAAAWPLAVRAQEPDRVRRVGVLMNLAHSRRISAAMEVARANGKKLGNPRLTEAAARGVKTILSNADQFAADVLPIIREIQKSGATSDRQVAAMLNKRGVKTARGGTWTNVQVRNALKREAATIK